MFLCYFPTTLQLHGLPGHFIVESCLNAKDAASLQAYNEKKVALVFVFF